MNNNIVRHIIRFITILLLQILIFKRIDISIGSFNYLHLLVYPLTIMLVPITTPKYIVLFVSFLLGISVDVFYNSPGVHAGALVFMAFARNYVLRWIEPVEGYNNDSTPTIFKMGFTWFLIYSSTLLLFHHFVYFSLEAFSYVYLLEILLRTISSFVASFIILMIIVVITNPKY